MKKKTLTVAIDGPVGAGKSSIANEVAKALNIPHLDTGAMYRGVGLLAIENHVDKTSEKDMNDFIENCSIDVAFTKEGQRIIGNQRDITEEIRTPEVSMAASDVSRWHKVRDKIVNIQQQINQKVFIVL